MCQSSTDSGWKQSFPASCAVKCQQIILHDYGIDVSESDLCRLASSLGWYKDNVGVFMRDNGKLLAGFGISYHHSQYNDITDIERELKERHKVMVNVNRLKLEIFPPPVGVAFHALVVADLDDDFVYVINSANGTVNKYSIPVFLCAWNDSRFYMLATDKALV